MARPLRIEYPGAFYHVMNRGQFRRNIFMEDKGRQSFLDLLADIAWLWKVKVYAYCLMDNHYHLLVSTPTGAYSGPNRPPIPLQTGHPFRLKSATVTEQTGHPV